MRKPIYVLLSFVLVLGFFSCSTEELDQNATLTQVTTELGDSNSGSSRVIDYPNAAGCLKYEMADENGNVLGLLVIGMNLGNVDFEFFTEKDWEIKSSYVTILECGIGEVPLDINGKPDPSLYQYANKPPKGSVENHIYVQPDFVSQVTCFSALSKINHPKFGTRYVYLKTQDYSETADFTNCPDFTFLEGIPLCYSSNFGDNMDFFIPLSESSSGVYPDAGTTSDSVSITPENPVSSGTVEIDMVFDFIDNKFTNAELNLSFVDLDLFPDTINAGGNVAVFKETLTILDSKNKEVAVLDEFYLEDGDFDWSVEINKNMIDEGSLKLTFILTSTIELISGNGLQVSNTPESIQGIALCGEIVEKK